MYLVVGALGDCSADLHNLVQTCAESRVEHLCQSIGRPELEGHLSVIMSQYRRLWSSCMVGAQAQCFLPRVGVISPQAREGTLPGEVGATGFFWTFCTCLLSRVGVCTCLLSRVGVCTCLLSRVGVISPQGRCERWQGGWRGRSGWRH